MGQGVETGQAAAHQVGDSQDKEDVKALKEKLASMESNMSVLEKKAATFDEMDKKYRTDPKFRATFDEAWFGKKENKQAAQDSTPEDFFKTELETSREKIKALEEQIEGVKEYFVGDKVQSKRDGLNVRYEQEFQELAEEVGYTPGTEAYEILFDNTVREGYNVAKKLGLVNGQGQSDPLIKYNELFMKEAFTKAFEKHKKAGFDLAWKRKQDALRIEKEKSTPNEMARFFKPENLKTMSDRARALEKAFKWKMRGADFKNLT